VPYLHIIKIKIKVMNELMNVRTIELLNEVLNKLNEEFDLVNDFSNEEVKYYIKISDLIDEIDETDENIEPKLIGLFDEEGKELIWELLDVSDVDDIDSKYRWVNRKSGEQISTYRLNKLEGRDKMISLWSKD
jgi:hypothetical protein